MSAPTDLTTYASAIAWINSALPSSNPDSGVIAECVTAASLYFLNRVGRPSMNTVSSYTERRNGNGNQQIFPRNDPLVSLTSLTVGAMAIPASTDGTQSGSWLSDDGVSIYLIGYSFTRGIQNVGLVYSAGFTSVPVDVQTSVEMLVAQMYKRRSYVDQASQALPQGGGTTMYRSWENDPFVKRTIQFWTPQHR